jgi:tetratricopeptide (TPR) repeat protein
MRIIILFLFSFIPTSLLLAQDNDSLDAWYKRGIALHDAGDYKGAIQLYDQIIKADENNYNAYYEKSYSLLADKQLENCIDLCKMILKKFPYGETNAGVYVNYGTALDEEGKADKAIKIYAEGISKFPTMYLLPFNKAITEYSQDNFKDAVADLKKSVTLKPNHSSSHLYLATCIYGQNRLAAILPMTIFLILEPEGKRATRNLPILEKMVGLGVTKNDSNYISLLMDASSLNDKSTEDNFHAEEMMMTLGLASAIGKATTPLSEVDKLHLSLQQFSESDSKKGFFSTYYLPFFKAMKQEDRLLTACHIICASSPDMDNRKWLESNQVKVQEFYKWMADYQWPHN